MYAANIPFKERLKTDNEIRTKTAKKHGIHYLFVAPFAIIFLVFTIMPVIIAILLGFTSFNMLEFPKFVGFDNYFRLFLNDSIFVISIKNTLVFALITGPLSYLLAFMFAWLINELARGFRVFFTVVFYAPSISGGMVVMWQFVFSGDQQGLVNGFLYRHYLESGAINFFQNEAYVVPLVCLIILWMSLGTTFLIFIGGLQGLDRQYYEAAAIDGIKNRWQELWYVTLPLMKPQLLLNAVLSISSAFGVGDIVTNLCGFPSINYAANTVINELNDYGTIRYEMGYACAIATLLFLLMIACNFGVHKLLKGVGA